MNQENSPAEKSNDLMKRSHESVKTTMITITQGGDLKFLDADSFRNDQRSNESSPSTKHLKIQSSFNALTRVDLEREIAAMTKRNLELASRLSKLEASRNTEVDSLHEKMEARNESFEMEVYRLEKKIESLNVANKAIRQNSAELKKTISDLMNAHETDVAILTFELNGQKQQCANLMAEKTQIQEQVEWLQGHVNDLKAQVDYLSK